MKRVLEPEVMCGANATAYADAPLDDVNLEFCQRLLRSFPELGSGQTAKVLDVGCGPGDIAVWLAEQNHALELTLVDASRDMLDFAKRRVEHRGLNARFELHHARVPEAELRPAAFDYLISNTFLHHLPDTRRFWTWARALLRAGSGVFVRDLRRPDTPAEVDALLDLHAAGADPLHREDYRNSFFAALTPAEVEADLRAANLDDLELSLVADRYWLVSGRTRAQTLARPSDPRTSRM